MPKVIIDDKKGLNQVAGGGLDVKQGELTWSHRMMTQDIVLAADDTATPFPNIALPQFCRVVSFKVEIIKVGAAAGTIIKVGTVGTDVLIHTDVSATITDLRELLSVSGFPLAAGAPAAGYAEAGAPNRVFEITHGNPGADGPTVRATVIVETVA